jgi:tetratricopeptide (TPR) repeat protein
MAHADLAPIIAAFQQKDYKTAARLIKPLLQASPPDPGVLLYAAKLQVIAQKADAAERYYRQVLQTTTNPKLAIQARQGLEDLEQARQAQRRDAIAAATADPDASKTGFLILDAIAPEQRQTAATHFARIFKLDPYVARFQMPNRGWRLYRMGPIGELQVYQQELSQAGIPAFCQSLDAVRQLHVFRVSYIQDLSPNPTIICQNEHGQTGALSFAWSEVTHRVPGLLPIFEQVVDISSRRKVLRKDATQDYAQVYDLHLPGRQSIVRFCDRTYQFQSGVRFDDDLPANERSLRLRWNKLAQYLNTALADIPAWADFTPFAESAVEQLELLVGLPHHLDLLRKAESTWDPAFHLYSSLIFLSNPRRSP